MTTPEQIAANQANAQHSTGPVTPEGKSRSAANARIHGLCAADILVGAEEKPEFDRMAIGYYIELSPKGELEQTVFDELMGAAWQLRRVRRMETEACAAANTYTALLDDEALQKKLDRLARHHTRIERTFHRCLKQLKELRAERVRQESLALHPAIERALRAMPEISERTQSRSRPPQFFYNSAPNFSAEPPEITPETNSLEPESPEMPPQSDPAAA